MNTQTTTDKEPSAADEPARNPWYEVFASGELILAAFVLLSALGLLIGGFIEPSTWSSTTKVVLAIYVISTFFSK